MYKFKNIDDYIPERFEQMGMLKGKRWYSKKPELGLFKPKRYEFGDRKIFCGNHYGEFVGYLLSLGPEIQACKAELAHLTKYYPNIHKERNHGTPIEKDGCITYNDLKENERLEHGGLVIEGFSMQYPKEYEELILKEKSPNSKNNYDNIEIILAAIESRVRDFYRKNGTSEEEIERLVQNEKRKMIKCIVYDCLYGNNDRHDENWAMRVDINGKYISLYPLYDNERVLGLYENQKVIEDALRKNTVESESENILFSRMRVPGESKNYSSYKDVLKYMLENYREETKAEIQANLSQNTPDRVSGYLEDCEGLPQCYKQFARRVYLSRREYAKNLIRTKKSVNLDEEQR